MEINEVLKALTAAKGITVLELSEKTGVNRQALYKFFAGGYSIGHEKLINVLNYFDLDVAALAKESIFYPAHKEENTSVAKGLVTLFSSMDELQRSYQLNYLITICEKNLAKNPDPKVEEAIRNIKKYYHVDGR